MSPKKPYQRRLPTVLPPALPPVQVPTPRVAPELEAPPPEADLLPEPATALDPEPEAEPEPEPEPELEPEPVRAVGRRATAALIGVAWLVGGGILAYALLVGLRDEPAAPEVGRTADPPRVLARAESYADTLVLPAGDLVVRQWIRSPEPLTSLELELPVVPGTDDLSADQVEVVADDVVVEGPERVTAAGTTYTFEEATSVLVTYRVQGAVQVSGSVAGRALAVVTTLGTTYAPRPERETRVVRGPAVLSLACSGPSDGSPEPCGRGTADDRWQVELRGDRVGDRVLAQLDLG